jgi:hypothetical protein
LNVSRKTRKKGIRRKKTIDHSHMEPEFLTFQKFDDPALADELTSVLDENGIAYEVEEQQFHFDPSLVLSNAKKEYAIKIKSSDFERVTQLLQANETENIGSVEPDYYLFGFTDDELMDVITKADEWSAFDVVLAQKILGDRGKALSDVEIEKIHEHRLEELKAPEPVKSAPITLGYIAAFFGGVLGIFIGWHIFSSKKTLPDGEQVYNYSEQDRKDGKIIFYLSIIIMVIAITAKIIVEVPWG